MLGRPLWNLPDPRRADDGVDLVGIGGDLDPATLIAGYRRGIFAMHVDAADLGAPEMGQVVGWWSPDPRGVLTPEDVHVSKSLRRHMGRFGVSVDRDFGAVVAGCADPNRPHGWITPEYVAAYEAMHAAGYAHSIEVWDVEGVLAGGLLCVEAGGLVAGESKFHRQTDASKVAVVALAGLLAATGPGRLIDTQWGTHHLATLGVREVPRKAYLAQLTTLSHMRPALETVGSEVRPARTLWARNQAG